MHGSTFEKHLNIVDYAISSLWRRRGKNIGVIVVFAAVIFLVASFQLVTSALTDTAARVLAGTPEITIQRMSAGRQEAIPLAYVEKLSGIFGIRSILPRVWGYYFDEVHGANLTVIGVDHQKMPSGERLAEALASGRLPGRGATGEVAVGQLVQKLFGLDERSVFSLFRPDLSLKTLAAAGSFSPDTDLVTADLMVMSLEDAQDLFGMDRNRVTDLCVNVANPSEVATIARKISEVLPDSRVLTRQQILKTYQVVFGWRSGFASVCLLGALFAFVIMAWEKASGLSPAERREISILKILGWETADVLAVRFWEGFVVSFLAFAIGCTAAYVHVAFFDASIFKPVMVGWSIVNPTLRLLPQVSVSDLLLVFCFTVLPYVGATVIPAWHAASVPADSPLRGN